MVLEGEEGEGTVWAWSEDKAEGGRTRQTQLEGCDNNQLLSRTRMRVLMKGTNSWNLQE